MDLNNLPDLAHIDDNQAQEICQLLRERIIDVVSKNGGHLASNLGAVELSVALHRVFDTQSDRIVFDVGHQCYSHKILTGRNQEMDTLRQFLGLSGYPKPSESEHDAFIAGHASNSVSVALGMARARTIRKEDYQVISLFGDGALTGGLAYEGLSNAGQSGEPLLVILNDNGMSITKNVGGIAEHLANQRLKPQYLRFKKAYRSVVKGIPGGKWLHKFSHQVKMGIKESLLPSSFFENMGFVYIGPVDGHNVVELTKLMSYAKSLECPVLLHARTVKGKGYSYAVETPDAFHGVSAFDLESGKPLKSGGENFSSVFGEALTSIADKHSNVCAITAAMRDGTGLGYFEQAHPERFFDVGIAEGHGVAMAAGMAIQGTIPVFAVYSSFLQRGYDMLIHDVSIQNLHAVFGIDRAGLVGEDGETHHGLFDVAYLSSVPGMTVYAPSSFSELRNQLELAVLETSGPVAIRYPRGGEVGYSADSGSEPTVVIEHGNHITLVAYGTTVQAMIEVSERLRLNGIHAEVIKINRIVPLDMDLILASVRKTGNLLVAEEVVHVGSVGQKIASELLINQVYPKAMELRTVHEGFIPQGSVSQLRKQSGLDAESLYDTAMEVLNREQ